LTPRVLTPASTDVRYEAGPSLRTVGLGATVSRSFQAPTPLWTCPLN
jgi:hypothetical protein